MLLRLWLVLLRASLGQILLAVVVCFELFVRLGHSLDVELERDGITAWYHAHARTILGHLFAPLHVAEDMRGDRIASTKPAVVAFRAIFTGSPSARIPAHTEIRTLLGLSLGQMFKRSE